MKYIFLIIFTSLTLVMNAQNKFEYSFKGQLSEAFGLHPEKPFAFQNTLRYIPEISLVYAFNEKIKLDSETSINAFNALNYDNSQWNSAVDLSMYRAWLRLSGKQFELRAGLQKINFGSAQLIRPLMWFDSVDPRDPQKITGGVYGALFRYYFKNNTNVWLWALAGNTKTKGLEFLPTAKKEPEFGGRLQLPIPKGEMALSYHYRKTDFSDMLSIPNAPPIINPEHRFAFDTKVDVGIGLWLETSATRLETAYNTIIFNKMTTLGIDYTFSVGNGLGIVTELMHIGSGDKLFNYSSNGFMFAGMLNYSVGISDSFSAISFIDFQSKDLYQFFSWQRTYDKFSFNLMLFWNPENSPQSMALQGGRMMAGRGVQMLVSYNF